jgi:hypothetical protein
VLLNVLFAAETEDFVYRRFGRAERDSSLCAKTTKTDRVAIPQVTSLPRFSRGEPSEEAFETKPSPRRRETE